MTRFLFLGDVIQDFNLMEYPPVPSHNYQALPKTMQVELAGGVRYLRDLINDVMPEKSADIQCPGDGWGNNAIKVFNAWKQFPRTTNDKKMVWRIGRIVGRTEPRQNICVDMVKADIKKATKTDFLVIENLSLGWLESFLSEEDSLGKELLEKAQPKQIILKLSSLNKGLPFAKTPDCLDKMTIVISAHTLRERGAAISEGLSWDRTIEDTVQEFETGLSSLDLALCRRVVVLFSAEGAAVFEREGNAAKIHLQKFLYHPSQYEGSFKADHPEQMSGSLSFVTAATVRHLALGKQYPLFVALSLSLGAIRKQYVEGIQEDEKTKDHENRFSFEKHKESLCAVLTLTDCLSAETLMANGKKDEDEEEKIKKQKKELDDYLKMFSCAFRHDMLEYPPLKYSSSDSDITKQAPWESNLLRDVTGYGYEYVAAKAFQIVMQGAKDALSNAPIASYGSFLTADRAEIERINAIRKLIIRYRENPKDKKPLSLAVFGPPGSGKSFSIKQLAAELGFTEKSIHTFNLSEFKDSEALHLAFHIVRDATIQGKIPLVFWDEFDCDSLKWLKEFLAPMQDAEFRAGSVVHPLGKAIFVFAGGVFSSFEEFEEKTRKEEKKSDQTNGQDTVSEADKKAVKQETTTSSSYEGKKGPDFISRLRGYVNIKGPNPQEGGDQNYEYLIRRAILLRSVLERNYGNLLGAEGEMAVSAPVVQAFLRVGEYEHGARSLESIVTMSDLVKASYFGEAALPPDHLLNLHVDAKDFLVVMKNEALGAPTLELISEACHEGWMAQKKLDGYEYGPERSDNPPKRHHLLVSYWELDEKNKEGNRLTARVTPAKLREAGLRIVRSAAARGIPGPRLSAANKDRLMKVEHDIWMRIIS